MKEPKFYVTVTWKTESGKKVEVSATPDNIQLLLVYLKQLEKSNHQLKK